MFKSKIEEQQVCDKCVLTTYITHDENYYILELNYMDGKFISEKHYPNDYNGFQDMEMFRSSYKEECDVKKHFGLI